MMSEFDWLDECCGKWEKLSPQRRTRQQQAVVDVCGICGYVAGDGVLQVWADFSGEMDRIVKSFEMADAFEIADLLRQSSFCRDIVARTPSNADDWQRTPQEEKKLAEIDLRIGELEPDAREGLLGFLPKQRK